MNFWRERQLFRLCCCILAGIAISALVSYNNDPHRSSMLRAGDFPGFYAPAVIIARGQTSRLYDPVLQRHIENEFWPEFFKGNYYMSVYPPYTMALLSPLGYLGPQAARNVFSILLLGAFVLSLFLLARHCRWSRRQAFIVAVLLLALAPLFYALIGGQNTAFSMLLYSGMLFFSGAIQDKASRRYEFLTGLCAGLWLFKPQFGVFACAVVLFSLRPAMILGAALSGIAYYFLGALLLGFDWPQEWLSVLSWFSAENYLANQHNQISLAGFLEALARTCGFPAVSGLMGWGISALLFLLYLAHFGGKNGSDRWRAGLLLFGPVLVLLSPQTLFYDLGIAFVSVLVSLNLCHRRQVVWLLSVIPPLWLLVLYREVLSQPVLFVVSLACLTIVWRSQVKQIA